MMAETAKANESPLKLPDSAPHTVSHMLGEIVWLMTQSPLHKHFALADLEWMVMPPILLQQFRVFHDKGHPVGVALWAFLSEEAEAKLSLMPVRLWPDDWKSGDRCWLVDLIAPGATVENKLAALMLMDLQRSALKGVTFQFHKTDLVTGERTVTTLMGQENAM
jgi:cytolysin-activating lysine-acyltransferase